MASNRKAARAAKQAAKAAAQTSGRDAREVVAATNATVIRAKEEARKADAAARKATAAKPPAKDDAAPLAPKAKARPLRACSCGCGGTTKGKWTIGHDARFHGAERKARDGRLTLAEFRAMFPAETIAREAPDLAA